MKHLYYPFILLALLMGQAFSSFAQKPQAQDPELQKLKAKLAAANHDTTRMMVYVDISFYFRDIAVLQDVPLLLDSAWAYSLKAKAVAEKHPEYSLVSEVWNNLGVVCKDFYFRSDNQSEQKYYFEKAEKYFKKSKDAAMKLENKKYLINPSFNLMELYNHSSKKYNFFKASFEIVDYIQSKKQWNKFDSIALRNIYTNLCFYLSYNINSEKYINYLKLSKKYTFKESLEYDEVSILIFEQHARLWKKHDEQKFLKEYEIYKKSIKTIYYNDQLDLYLAQYYFTINEYEKSFRLLAGFYPRNHYNILQSNKIRLAYLGMKYMLMGQSVYMLNRNQESIRYLRKAIANFNAVTNQIRLENEKYTALLYLGKAYKKAEKYQQALACNEQADTLYRQMHDVAIEALMAENDVHLEQIKQEKKVQEARTQTLLKEQEIEIQKKQKYAFLAISILALFSAAWAVYSFIETRKQNKIISQQAAALAESNHVKDRIFALLSHDLRSPINRLVMNLNQSIEIQHTHIQAELKGVQDILNNVLYWASMQLKKAAPVPVSVPLQPLAEELMEEYRYALEEKGITFLNNIENDVEIKTDEGYLKIVLRNLISNAIKFTEVGGYIQIACRSVQGGLEILLKDTGVGISTDKLDSLFQLPLPSVGTNKEKGTGLGLSLSHDIVQKLGGSLNIQSKQGKGTQVVVALPV